MFAAADVHYLPAREARAALVLAAGPAFASATYERVVVVPEVAPYVPGEFWRRELPCLRAVLDGVKGLSLLMVDGYVDLAPSGRAGLGAHAAAEFGVPVIGVAKTRFAAATHAVEVRRGTAMSPLFVTATGLPLADAAELVRAMPGRYRLPDALRRVDALARRGQAGGAAVSRITAAPLPLN